MGCETIFGRNSNNKVKIELKLNKQQHCANTQLIIKDIKLVISKFNKHNNTFCVFICNLMFDF